MTPTLKITNVVAIAVSATALVVLAFARVAVAWFAALHLLAAMLALRAARPGAGTTLRGWAIGINAWCVIVDAVLLAAFAYGAARGLAPMSGKLAVVAAVLVSLPLLCAHNLRALVGPRAGDA